MDIGHWTFYIGHSLRPLFVILLLSLVAAPAVAQRDSVLATRWVGSHGGRLLVFEFYGDTMLVINDQHALSFRLTRDSLVAMGDTLINGRYRMAMGRLLLDTPEGLVTMSPQPALARPLTGRWVGSLFTDDGAEIELVIFLGGTARWRRTGGNWVTGEWERATRLITLVWPDGTEWVGQYDPLGNAILFEETLSGSGATILRRSFR